jgi:hypothetical protein
MQNPNHFQNDDEELKFQDFKYDSNYYQYLNHNEKLIENKMDHLLNIQKYRIDHIHNKNFDH